MRSTDRYFNEYVPKNLSYRAHITGFDGSVGDALITKDHAHLFVDGRYSVQARMQAKDFSITVCDNAMNIEGAWLNAIPQLLKPEEVLAYDPSTIDVVLFEKLQERVACVDAQLKPDAQTIFSKLFGDSLQLASTANPSIFAVDKAICGLSTQQKLALVAERLKKDGSDAFLAVKLDDVAWICNLRSYYFPYQSAIPGIAVVFFDQILLGLNSSFRPPFPCINNLKIVGEHEIFSVLKRKCQDKDLVLGMDPYETSKAHEIALREQEIELKQVRNPICSLKAIKNEKELLHMRHAFKKADIVVHQTQDFVINSFNDKNPLNEVDVFDFVEGQFKKSGSTELSFRPICASGKNGAIIHYGTPDNKEVIQEGSLFLLDTGAYYEGGYATDLTRTFLAAGSRHQALSWQKELFTLVLKASIRGLSARLRRGSVGMQLDAMVREPLWQVGLDFAHGTGHGVGINVHEFPPRIGPTSTTPLLEGHVFSIEPGLYIEGLGGVRIENLATIVADPDHNNFVRVLPLTFCPLDERLIEEEMLDSHEKQFLRYCEKEWGNQAEWPNLPPLSSKRF